MPSGWSGSVSPASAGCGLAGPGRSLRSTATPAPSATIRTATSSASSDHERPRPPSASVPPRSPRHRMPGPSTIRRTSRFSHNGDLRDYRAARDALTQSRAGSTAARTARGAALARGRRSDDEPVAHLLGRPSRRLRGEANLAVPTRDGSRTTTPQSAEPGVHLPTGRDRDRLHGPVLLGPVPVPLCGDGRHRSSARASPCHHRAR